MSFLGQSLAELLLETNAVNPADAERRIHILAARLTDDKTRKWFVGAVRNALKNFDKLADEYAPEPKPWYTAAAKASRLSHFGPTDPANIPAEQMSVNLLAKLYGRGPHGPENPAWWHNVEPESAEDPEFTYGHERPPILRDDDPRLLAVPPEEREQFRQRIYNQSRPHRLSDFEPPDKRLQRIAQKKAAAEQTAREIQAEKAEAEQLRREQALARKSQGGKQGGAAVKEHIQALLGHYLSEAVEESPRYQQWIKARLNRALGEITAAATAQGRQNPPRFKVQALSRPNLFKVAGPTRAIIGGTDTLTGAGFTIDSKRPDAEGALVVRYVPQYTTKLHRHHWQAMAGQTGTLKQALAKLGIETPARRLDRDRYVLDMADPTLDQEAHDIRAKIASEEGRDTLAQAGYVLDLVSEPPVGHRNGVVIRHVRPEFSAYDSPKAKDYRYGQNRPLRGWKELRIPDWAAHNVAGKTEGDEPPVSFNVTGAGERDFWRNLSDLVTYLNKLATTSAEAGSPHRAGAAAALNKILQASPADTGIFLNAMAEAEQFVAGAAFSDKSEVVAQVQNENGKFTLVRLNTPEAVNNYSRRPSSFRRGNGSRDGWCTGWDGIGLTQSKSWLANGGNRMYVVLKDTEMSTSQKKQAFVEALEDLRSATAERRVTHNLNDHPKLNLTYDDIEQDPKDPDTFKVKPSADSSAAFAKNLEQLLQYNFRFDNPLPDDNGYYTAHLEGDSYALLTPHHAINNADNERYSPESYFYEFADLFDGFGPDFFKPADTAESNFRTFASAIASYRRDNEEQQS